MRRRFDTTQGPIIAGIMAGKAIDALLHEARLAQEDGAQGIAIDLSDLEVPYRNRESLAGLIDAIPLPVMLFFYRDDKQQNLDDAARQELLIAGAEAGAAMIDVMGDLYDPSPMEITRDSAAIAKQRQLIDRIQAIGAEVVISSHMDCPRSGDQVLEHLRALAERGAEVVKLVCTVNSDEELAEAMATTMKLKRELGQPFIHLCNGSHGRPHRFLCPALGCAISFGVHSEDNPYGLPQPETRAMRAVLDELRWQVDDVARWPADNN